MRDLGFHHTPTDLRRRPVVKAPAPAAPAPKLPTKKKRVIKIKAGPLTRALFKRK